MTTELSELDKKDEKKIKSFNLIIRPLFIKV